MIVRIFQNDRTGTLVVCWCYHQRTIINVGDITNIERKYKFKDFKCEIATPAKRDRNDTIFPNCLCEEQSDEAISL